MEGQDGFQWPTSGQTVQQAPHRRSPVRTTECSGSTWAGGSTPLAIHREGDTLRLVGEVDLATCPALVKALDTAIEQPAGDIVIDCAGVTFFGAVGADALVRVHNRLDGSGRRIIVRNPTAVVKRLLDIAQLSELFADASDTANSASGD
jgi:anti-anti-sigma factor